MEVQQRVVAGAYFEKLDDLNPEEVRRGYTECWYSEHGTVYRLPSGRWKPDAEDRDYPTFEEAAAAAVAAPGEGAVARAMESSRIVLISLIGTIIGLGLLAAILFL